MVDSRPSRVSVSVQPVLHLLGYELQLASLRKESLPEVTHSLLELTLRLLGKDPSCRRNHFFSFTETKSDYSLILDRQLVQVLRGTPGLSSVEVVEDKWRPLVVELGVYGSLVGISKIAASVIGPLADQHVSVFCLSTNQEDYVMVKERDLERALQCLSSQFRLVSDSESVADNSLVDAINKIPFQRKEITLPYKHCYSEQTPRLIVHPFVCADELFHVCSILPQSLPSVTLPLLQTMFYRHSDSSSSSTEPFFSISIIDDDITLVVNSKDLQRFPVDLVYSSDVYWRVVTIGNGPLGFDECGIVAQLSAPLAQAEISTYYISTFYTDNTLIPHDCVSKALDILNKNIDCTKTSKCQLGHINTITTATSGVGILHNGLSH